MNDETSASPAHPDADRAVSRRSLLRGFALGAVGVATGAAALPSLASA